MTITGLIPSGETLRRLNSRIRTNKGYNIGVNCGKTSGQSVMHVHVHLIPRYSGDTESPNGGVRGVIPEKMKYI
ncbi:MAG: HIT family protein [Synergistaceae bacterium]